jgi:hypothetical protein
VERDTAGDLAEGRVVGVVDTLQLQEVNFLDKDNHLPLDHPPNSASV